MVAFLCLLASIVLVASVFQLSQPSVGSGVVEAGWLANNFSRDIRLVAVGSDESIFKDGYIPNSVLLLYRDILAKNSSIAGLVLDSEAFKATMSRLGVTEKSTILLYDYQSGLYAARAYWTLYYYGHKSLLLLDGGLSSWIKHGFPLSSTSRNVAPSVYNLNAINRHALATLSDVRKHLYDPGVIILDVRSSQEYLDGHIPGAINVEWSISLTSEGTFRSTQELKALFDQYGVTAGKTIITYCRTGVRGAHTWFVLSRILNYPNVMLYDGSWEEWVATGQPIER